MKNNFRQYTIILLASLLVLSALAIYVWGISCNDLQAPQCHGSRCEICQDGVCKSKCYVGQICCNGVCSSSCDGKCCNPNNCEICVDGVCKSKCDTGQICCNGVCSSSNDTGCAAD